MRGFLRIIHVPLTRRTDAGRERAPTPRGNHARSAVVLACALASWSAHAPTVRAYCRASVTAESEDDANAANSCTMPDSPNLIWTRSCITYTFKHDAFLRLKPLDEASTRDMFNASFAAWAAVDCDGRKPFFVEQASGTTPLGPKFVTDAENVSVISVYSGSEWAQLPGHSPEAFALTVLWYDRRGGTILDVDMDLNLGLGEYADCVKQRCPVGTVDLQNTITHEAGHVLGLSHSPVRGSSMSKQAFNSAAAETTKRTLEADDRAGYCALSLPEWTCVGASCTCPPPPIYRSRQASAGTGCSSVSRGASVPWPVCALLIGGLFVSRRMRRAHR